MSAHIRWTPDETTKIADAFMDLRATCVLGDTLELLRSAMEDALPKDRWRNVYSINVMAGVIELLSPRRLYVAGSPQVPAALPPPLVYEAHHTPPTHVPTPAPASPLAPPAPAPAPIVLEFRIPQAPKLDDIQHTLANAPTALLLGAALERVLNGPPRTTFDVVRTTFDVSRDDLRASTAAQAPVANTLPTRRKVVVVGLLPDATLIVAERVKAFTNLDVVFRNPTTAGNEAPLICDYAILMRGIVNTFQADAVRRRFVRAADQKRLIMVDGGNDKVLQELNTLNAQQ